MLNYNSEKENKAKVAVALSYNPGDDAPTVIASGKGALAERITKAASENDIPVYIGKDIYHGTYIRCGEGDFRCSPEQVKAMIEKRSVF